MSDNRDVPSTLSDWKARQNAKAAQRLAEGHACRNCGAGVTSKDPVRYPFCSNCHYTGIAAEIIRSEQLDRFRGLLPGAEPAVWHTGGGCFMLAIQFPDDDWTYTLTNGEAGLPETQDEGPIPNGGWGYLGRVLRDDDDGASWEDPSNILYYYNDPDAGGDPEMDQRYWDEYPTHGASDEAIAELILADREHRGA